ncbi:MAG: hypothetical protein PVJ53_02195 [Desulfobacterales bacterium]
MVVYDDIFSWKGWGGPLKLAKGRCWLQIFDLNRAGGQEVLHLRPMVVVASDLPREGMLKGEVSVRSAAGHIATVVSRKFNIAPQRMQFVEYTPRESYGRQNEYVIAASFDAVEFTWQDGLALFPRIGPLDASLLPLIVPLVEASPRWRDA